MRLPSIYADLVYIEIKKHRQAIPAHRPDEGQTGDCYRACVASLVGWGGKVENVPHFVEERQQLDDNAPWTDLARARRWCRLLDLDLLTMTHEEAIGHGVPYIVSVPSKTGSWPHCVIGQAGEVIWDPSGVGGYTLDVLSDDVVEVLCTPYDLDPDEMVRQFAEAAAESGDDESGATNTAESSCLGPDLS